MDLFLEEVEDIIIAKVNEAARIKAMEMVAQTAIFESDWFQTLSKEQKCR